MLYLCIIRYKNKIHLSIYCNTKSRFECYKSSLDQSKRYAVTDIRLIVSNDVV